MNEMELWIVAIFFLVAVPVFGFCWLDDRHTQRLKEAEERWNRNIFEECDFYDCQLNFEKGNALFIDEKDADWDAELKKLPRSGK